MDQRAVLCNVGQVLQYAAGGLIQGLQGDREGGGDVDVVNSLMGRVDQGAVSVQFWDC